MKQYIRTKAIGAEPCMRENDEGYMVIYADGHESWFPKTVFKATYHPMGGMAFWQAIEAMGMGLSVRRRGWHNNGLFIALQLQDANANPCIYIDITGLRIDNQDAHKNRVPWLASQTDMLAEDWEVVATEMEE